MRHDLKWVKEIANMYFQEKKRDVLIKPFYLLFTKIIEWQGKKRGVL